MGLCSDRKPGISESRNVNKMRARSLHLRLSGARDAAWYAGIGAQSAFSDLLVANDAVTEVTGTYPVKGREDAFSLELGEPIRSLRHGMLLHGIHTGKPSCSPLVQLNRS